MNMTTGDHPRVADDDSGRWYLRGIWPMVIAIPALTVIAGLSTVVIANYKSDPLVEDATRPDVVAMHADPRPDAAAVARGLSGEIDTRGGSLSVELRGLGQDAPVALNVVFAHAAKETFDQTATAARTAPGVYAAKTPVLAEGPWTVEVAPGGRPWRLVGELDRTGGTTRLHPFQRP